MQEIVYASFNCVSSLHQSNTKDYTNVPYDRGHMAPAADFICCPDIRDATFTMANICPQVSSSLTDVLKVSSKLAGVYVDYQESYDTESVPLKLFTFTLLYVMSYCRRHFLTKDFGPNLRLGCAISSQITTVR